MGKYISFYIVDKGTEHKKHLGQKCFDLEFQPDQDIIKEKMLEQHDIEYELICNNQKHSMCPKCKMFMIGICDDVVKDSLHIRHSYSNNIWSSDYNIQDLSLGSSTTNFVKLFRNDMQYFEIFANHVDRGYAYLKELGKPIRANDQEAYNETLRILRFLEKWMNDTTVHMIMEYDV